MQGQHASISVSKMVIENNRDTLIEHSANQVTGGWTIMSNQVFICFEIWQ